MKKIMFKDRYGLTKAVLEGRKTMTRRIVPEKVLEAYYDYDDYVNAVAPQDIPYTREWEEEFFLRRARFEVGEVVAVAQAYKNLVYSFHGFATNPSRSCGIYKEYAEEQKGWGNKMFVEPKFMPHHIKITDIKAERLQDISDEDCLKEGIEEDFAEGLPLYWWPVPHEGISWEEYKKRDYELSRHELNGETGSYFWDTPQGAFAALIDKVTGKGTWDSNPFVFAYEFELVD